MTDVDHIPIDAPSSGTFHRRLPWNWYTAFVYPWLRLCRDPESANEFSKIAVNVWASLFDAGPDDQSLNISIFGKTFSNPIGMAAGWDKDAEKFSGLPNVGFGFAEVGTVTPLRQAGNSRVRVFRLPHDSAVVNRMGFPSEGLECVLQNLNQKTKRGILGINVGANKDSEDRVLDYVKCAVALAPHADYLVCNVSSPNTPGLRSLQARDQLTDLIRRVQDGLGCKRPPLLIKIAPDASEIDLDGIVRVCRDLKVDGLIVGNTTIKRPVELRSKRRTEAGGLSGAPLTRLSTRVLKCAAYRVERQFPLIGCGGVFDGNDAYEKIRAGASLIQLYTSLIYGGPPLVRSIKLQLAALLRRDKFASISEAVGADLRG